jgi:predicted permease
MTAATAIFTVVDSIVFRPLDLPDSHRIVIVCEDHARLGGACIASPATTEDFRRATSTLSELGWGRGWPFHLTDEQGSEGVRGGLATASFFRALGVQPELGRLFADDEVGPDRDGVVVLSHALWTERYGRDPGAVGSTVWLEGEPYAVVGVLPERFAAPFDLDGIELWKPPHVDVADPPVRGWRGFRAIGRLADGASLAAAEAELTGVYAGLAERHEEIDDEWRLRVDALQRVVVGDSRLVLLAFLGGAGLLLAIVCANVANLVLARGLARRSELAVRAALGAERGRLVRQILSESLILAVAATAIAVLLASGASRVLLAVAPPDIPRLDEVALDARVIGAAGLAALVLTAAFALLPALRVTSWNLGQVLKSGAREGEERGSGRLRGGLLAAELALAVVLLASAGLLTRSFTRWLDWEPGFDHGSLLAVSVFVDTGKHPTRARFMDVLRQGEARVAALPGVVSAATASAGPLFGGGDGAADFATEEADPTGPLPSAWWYDIGPGYFATLGLPVVRGRELTEADGPDVEPVAVVNEAFARVGWADGEAVGRTVRLPELEATFTIVGVVADVPPLRPGVAARPEIYWANRQRGRPAPFLLVRTTVDPATVAPAVTAALLEVDPDLSLGTPYTLTSSEARALVRPRFQALVMLALALVALVLSAVGVYAVVSYAAERRVREMGIRRALGASTGRVVGLVVRTSVAVSAVGVAAGLLAALWVGRLIRGMIPGVPAGDPVSLGGAALVLLGAAALAAAVPALRAGRADPLAAIKVD